MPLEPVPTAPTVPLRPTFGKALRAFAIFDAKVASVAVQVIDPVAKPPNNRVNVPPVGVPPIVTVCTHDVPATGAPAQS